MKRLEPQSRLIPLRGKWSKDGLVVAVACWAVAVALTAPPRIWKSLGQRHPSASIQADTSRWKITQELEPLQPGWGMEALQLVVNLPGGYRKVLTSDPEMQYTVPSFSPDGRYLLFAGSRFADRRSRDCGIYVAEVIADQYGRPAGLGGLCRLVPLSETGDLGAMPCWAPDSRTIAYASSVSGRIEEAQDIFVADVETGHTRNLTNTRGLRESRPAFSPAGGVLAFDRLVQDRPWPRRDIFTVPVRGGSVQRVTRPADTPTQLNGRPAWTADGRSIIFYDPMTQDEYLIAADGRGPSVPQSAPSA